MRDAADRGLAVLMVTHRLPEVRQYCDEIVVLRDGVTVARFDRERFTSERSSSRWSARLRRPPATT